MKNYNNNILQMCSKSENNWSSWETLTLFEFVLSKKISIFLLQQLNLKQLLSWALDTIENKFTMLPNEIIYYIFELIFQSSSEKQFILFLPYYSTICRRIGKLNLNQYFQPYFSFHRQICHYSSYPREIIYKEKNMSFKPFDNVNDKKILRICDYKKLDDIQIVTFDQNFLQIYYNAYELNVPPDTSFLKTYLDQIFKKVPTFWNQPIYYGKKTEFLFQIFPYQDFELLKQYMEYNNFNSSIQNDVLFCLKNLPIFKTRRLYYNKKDFYSWGDFYQIILQFYYRPIRYTEWAYTIQKIENILETLCIKMNWQQFIFCFLFNHFHSYEIEKNLTSNMSFTEKLQFKISKFNTSKIFNVYNEATYSDVLYTFKDILLSKDKIPRGWWTRCWFRSIFSISYKSSLFYVTPYNYKTESPFYLSEQFQSYLQEIFIA